MPGFPGLKLCAGKSVTREGWGIRHVRTQRIDRLQLVRAGSVGWGGNSGFHAVNLAVQWGAARLLLVGFDMRVDAGLHWHGPHGGALRNPDAAGTRKWREILDAAAETLAAIGVEVVNCSAVSALQAYPKMPFEEALNADPHVRA